MTSLPKTPLPKMMQVIVRAGCKQRHIVLLRRSCCTMGPHGFTGAVISHSQPSLMACFPFDIKGMMLGMTELCMQQLCDDKCLWHTAVAGGL